MNRLLILSFMLFSSLFSPLKGSENIPDFIPIPITVTFPQITYARDYLKVDLDKEPNILEYNVIGNFFKDDYPVIFPDNTSKLNSSPFVVLQKLLYIYNVSKKFEDTLLLADPSLPEQIKSNFLEMIKKEKVRKTLESYKKIEVISYYLIPPDQCVLILKLNKEFLIYNRYAFKNGQWYTAISNNDINEEVTMELMNFYLKNGNNDSESIIIEKPSKIKNLIDISKNTPLVSFYNKLAAHYKLPAFSSFLKDGIKPVIENIKE